MNSLMFLSEGESEEEDVLNLGIHRRQLRHKLDLPTMLDVEFVVNFRINKRFFITHPKHTRGLTALHKLAATLKFLAQGSYQRGVGNDFTIPIGQSTFSKVSDQTLRIIQRELKHYD
uniref:Uncharacterized protein n=1 Tax=Anopheles atroparvus TaxID=41427 RepID=A0AAG5DP72_ANOAO